MQILGYILPRQAPVHNPYYSALWSLFGRAPAGASTLAPAGAVPNACFGKGSTWGAGQELEPFFACVGEASKTSFAWLLAVGSRRLVRMSRFAKRFQNGFSFSRETAPSEEPDPEPFSEESEPCQTDP